MKAKISDEKNLEDIRRHYEKKSTNMSYGENVRYNAWKAMKAIDIVKNDNIEKVQNVFTYEHNCTVIFTRSNAIFIKHAKGEANFVTVNVGGSRFVISDRDGFAIFS